MISFSAHPDERRQNLRFAINHQSRLRLTLDDTTDSGDTIEGVTLTDISQQGLMAAGAGQLIPGARLMLEVPLVGWREVEVRWIAENRAGCRFVEPLSFEQLRLAAASSERLAAECPTLAGEIAELTPATDLATDDEEDGSSGWRHRLWWLLMAGVLILMGAGSILLLR
jgi:hypothetical protein